MSIQTLYTAGIAKAVDIVILGGCELAGWIEDRVLHKVQEQ